MLKRRIGSLNERIGELNKENQEHKTVTVQMASYMVGMLGKTKSGATEISRLDCRASGGHRRDRRRRHER